VEWDCNGVFYHEANGFQQNKHGDDVCKVKKLVVAFIPGTPKQPATN